MNNQKFSHMLTLVAKDGKMQVINELSKISKLISNIIEGREQEAVLEEFPLEKFTRDTISLVIKFGELVDFDGEGSVVKTKPITRETKLEELFENQSVLEFFKELS
jgi:hypothetical protein